LRWIKYLEKEKKKDESETAESQSLPKINFPTEKKERSQNKKNSQNRMKQLKIGNLQKKVL
jgi:hypothetical protein